MFSKIKIKRKNLSSIAYDSIKQGIVSGELNNNQLLSENILADILNMSRTPIREAIRRLEAENYLKSINGVGIMVLELTLQDLSEIYEVRIALEKVALETSIFEIKKEQIEELERDFQKIISAYKINQRVDKEELYQLDLKFHSLLYSLSKNNCLKEILSSLEKKIHRYQYKAYNVTDTGKEATLQHMEILGEIRKQNLKRVKELIEKHIKWSFKVLKEYMLNENMR